MGDLSKWLPPMLVVIGWALVFTNNDRYAKRSEIRGLCNDIDKLLTELSQGAIEFWLKGKDREQSDIQAYVFGADADLEKLEFKLKLLGERGTHCNISLSRVNELLVDLLDAVTLDAEKIATFDDIDRNKKAFNAMKIAALCIKEVELAFSKVANQSFAHFVYTRLLQKIAIWPLAFVKCVGKSRAFFIQAIKWLLVMLIGAGVTLGIVYSTDEPLTKLKDVSKFSNSENSENSESE